MSSLPSPDGSSGFRSDVQSIRKWKYSEWGAIDSFPSRGWRKNRHFRSAGCHFRSPHRKFHLPTGCSAAPFRRLPHGIHRHHFLLIQHNFRLIPEVKMAQVATNRKQIRRAVVFCFYLAVGGGTTAASARYFRSHRKSYRKWQPIRRKCCGFYGRCCPGDFSSSWALELRCFRKTPEVIHRKWLNRKRCGCTAGTWRILPDSTSADNPNWS